MDQKSYTIGILCITALLLFIAQFLPVQTAQAGASVQAHDYQMVTALISQGGEGLYVIERRSGKVAVFSWDVNDRRIKLRAVRSINDAILQ